MFTLLPCVQSYFLSVSNHFVSLFDFFFMSLSFCVTFVFILHVLLVILPCGGCLHEIFCVFGHFVRLYLVMFLHCYFVVCSFLYSHFVALLSNFAFVST